MPNPVRSTVSCPAVSCTRYASPTLGARSPYVVCHNGVFPGASCVTATLVICVTVYGDGPLRLPGGGSISHLKPTESDSLGATLHSSCAKAEKFLYKGSTGSGAKLYPWA